MRFRKRGRFSLIIRVFLKAPAEDEFGMVQTGYKKASCVAETQFARGEEKFKRTQGLGSLVLPSRLLWGCCK